MMFSTISQVTAKSFAVINAQPWAIKLITLCLATLAPLKIYVFFLVFLLVIDAITSIYYQFRKNVNIEQMKVSFMKKLKILFTTIESGKLRRTFEKMVAYTLGMIVCFLFDKIALQITPLEGNPLSFLSLANIATVMVCGVEVFSILENISKITDNPVWLKIASIFKKKIDDKIDAI